MAQEAALIPTMSVSLEFDAHFTRQIRIGAPGPTGSPSPNTHR